MSAYGSKKIFMFNSIMMCTCRMCKEAKPLLEKFNHNKSKPYGFQEECKSCRLLMNKSPAARVSRQRNRTIRDRRDRKELTDRGVRLLIKSRKAFKGIKPSSIPKEALNLERKILIIKRAMKETVA